MAAKQENLGKTPESHPERQLDVCPTCEREFKGIQDYPSVFIVSVSLATPLDVPAEVPHWYKEDLLAAPKKGWRREFVPREVLTYFRRHPDENKLMHSDSYIYYRPFNQTQEYRRRREAHPEMYNKPGVVSVGGDHYERQFNYASTIRALLAQNTPLSEYLVSLRQMVGQEVFTKEVFPEWQQDDFPGAFQIPHAYRLLLKLNEDKQNTAEYRVAEIGIWAEGPNRGRAGGPTITSILTIGALNYEGRVNRT